MDEQAKLMRVFSYPFGDIYSNYVTKVERKDRTVAELDEVLTWFAGLTVDELHAQAESDATLRDFFGQVTLDSGAELITGSVCGVRVEDVEDPLMRKIRKMDKIVDELARGKAVDKIIRSS